ncbi:MAG: hypothetical protein ACRCV5_19145 [Afipia sp.]
MRGDAETQVCKAQAFTGAATVSSDSYAKQTAAQKISIGRRMCFLIHITTAAGAGTSSLWEVIQADDAALTSNVEALASVTKAAAAQPKGAKFEIPIPQGSDTKKYLGIRNTNTGGTTTVSADAFLVPLDEVEQYKSFEKVNNVSV